MDILPDALPVHGAEAAPRPLAGDLTLDVVTIPGAHHLVGAIFATKKRNSLQILSFEL
jgi:hypothetical protein